MIRSIITVVGLLFAFCVGSLVAEEPVTYKEYKRNNKQKLFKIVLKEKEIGITAYDGEAETTNFYNVGSLEVGEGRVYSGTDIVFDQDGLILPDGSSLEFSRISDLRVIGSSDRVSITAHTRGTSGSLIRRFKVGNRISATEGITVAEDEFVRGAVFSVAGDIEIYGEVNRDVVSLLGDIYVGPGAVVRGDIVTMSGRVDLAREASVYGEVITPQKGRRKYRHRFSHREEYLSENFLFVYNRVDGATPYFGLKFFDSDSLLPTIVARGGYGFESKKWRYDFSLEQTLMHQPALAIGGNFYRRLVSSDTSLLSACENTFFALTVTEDFMDYYEAEGGNLYIRSRPWEPLTIEGGYRYEETGWLEANRNLWSLFGGGKKFGDNFQRVPEISRTASALAIDNTINANLYCVLNLDTRDEDKLFRSSAWHFTGDLEWSHADVKSDFDYKRYRVVLRRYQKVNRHAMLLLRAVWGSSTGYLPMYKRFYVGGLGTLAGYLHKEFMGDKYWMANAEYRVRFPGVQTATGLFWDGARITNGGSLGDADVKQDIGLAIYIEDDFKVSIAKRLDSSSEDDAKIYVRLDHIF